jgi:RnfABCDGE-type electron transport complex B subunit
MNDSILSLYKSVEPILNPILIMAALGAGMSAMLLFAAKKFVIKENPQIEEILESLPGANCGGCGFAGCRAFAEEKVKNPSGDAFCPPGAEKVNRAIAEILGTQMKSQKPMIARLKCAGTHDVSAIVGEYEGIPDCRAAMLVFPGQKICPYGCIGYGSCMKACQFGAISKYQGIVRIDEEKCVGCRACVNACPKRLIEMMPRDSTIYVACSSNDRGGQVRTACSAGCIGCMQCEKTCPVEAVKVTDFLSRVDQEKCIKCGKCVDVCPVQVIVNLQSRTAPVQELVEV